MAVKSEPELLVITARKLFCRNPAVNEVRITAWITARSENYKKLAVKSEPELLVITARSEDYKKLAVKSEPELLIITARKLFCRNPAVNEVRITA